jgi:hypothetical protein
MCFEYTCSLAYIRLRAVCNLLSTFTYSRDFLNYQDLRCAYVPYVRYAGLVPSIACSLHLIVTRRDEAITMGCDDRPQNER